MPYENNYNANNNKITRAQLAPYVPCVVQVRGKVAFSHISHHYDGKELEEYNTRQKYNGYAEETKPFISLTISDPHIVDDGSVNPLVGQFLQEQFRTSINQAGQQETKYYGKSKSPSLPIVAYGSEAGELAGQGVADKDVPLKAELANGMDVTIGVKFYRTKQARVPVGTGIDFVILNEPIKYYSPSSLESALLKAGITQYIPPKVTEQTAEAVQQPQAAPAQAQAPAPMPAPAPMVPNTTPVSVSPMANVQANAQANVPQNIPQNPQPTQPTPMYQTNYDAQMSQAASNPMVGG